MDYQQGFIVGVGSRGRPFEGSSDHRAVVDHGELVMQLLERVLPVWVLRDAHASQATS